MKETLFFITLFLKFAILNSQVNIDIEKIQDYKKEVKIISSNLMFNDSIDTSTFSIKTYMGLYPSLKIRKKNYVFDYYYFDDFLDGKPYIYVRNKRFDLIKDVNKKADERKLKGEERTDFILRSLHYFLNDPINRANKNVIPEDTEKGYVHYLYFCEFGELFALKWHAGYKKKQVICSKKEIEGILKGYAERQIYADTINNANDFLLEDISHCDTVALQNLLLLDSIISVQFNEDNVIVKWIELKEWSGIFEMSYKIMRTSPYHIELINEKRLAEIQKGYVY